MVEINIKEIFSSSFNLLWNNKKIMIPIFLSIIFSLILGSIFLNVSGLSTIIKGVYSASSEFESQKTNYLMNATNIGNETYSSELFTYLSKGSRDSPYNKQLSQYLEEQGFEWSKFKELINSRNILLLIVYIAISLIGLLYFSCMTYSMIALAIHKKDIEFKNVIRVTNRFLFQFIWLQILLIFIVVMPIILLTGIVVYFYSFSKILSILSGLMFFFLIIVYIIFISLRLFFAIPVMYIDQERAINSIKNTFQITKGRIWHVIIIFFIIFAIASFSNTLVNQPFSNIYSSIIFGSNWLKISISLIVLLIFILLKAFLSTFQHTFLFYSYIEFKVKGGQNKMVNNYLADYVKEQLKNGYDIKAIREAMLTQGYKKQEVEESIKYAQSNSKNITKSGNRNTGVVNMSNPQYQGFWIRFVSYVILDSIIIGIPLSLLQFGLIYATGTQSMTYLTTLLGAVIIIYMDGIKGGTPGKLILGMRIVNEKGEYIGIPMAILRYIGKIVSGIILGIGYFMIGWDEKKQGLHDKIAQTYVIKV